MQECFCKVYMGNPGLYVLTGQLIELFSLKVCWYKEFKWEDNRYEENRNISLFAFVLHQSVG